MASGDGLVIGARRVYRGRVSPVEADAAPQDGPSSRSWGDLPRRGRGLSLRTLIILRWLALAGQSATLFTATVILHFDLPLLACASAVAAGAAFNLFASSELKGLDPQPTDGRRTALHLGFDMLQLTVLLALTGGLQNPFCLLLVAPATVAAASLPARQALALGALALLAAVALFHWSMPLPWAKGTELNLPPLYRFGIGLALVTGVVFTATYAWRVAADAEKLELALATTQDVLQREQRLAAMGGLAAAAAHELGTPLATIQVVAKEMRRAAGTDGALAEDAALILQQAERCRDILKRLSQAPEDDGALTAAVELRALLEEVIQPHRGFDLDFEASVRTRSGDRPPQVRRLPEVVHGLSTLVENAADFAAAAVRIEAVVDAGWIEVSILDDGPGFAPDILPRLGEPYVTSRPQGKARRALTEQIAAAAQAASGRRPRRTQPQVQPSQGGMGLGFFIARTLLERSGGEVSVGSANAGERPLPGARVTVRWPRPALESSQAR